MNFEGKVALVTEEILELVARLRAFSPARAQNW
jgi:hypothetical protein